MNEAKDIAVNRVTDTWARARAHVLDTWSRRFLFALTSVDVRKADALSYQSWMVVDNCVHKVVARDLRVDTAFRTADALALDLAADMIAMGVVDYDGKFIAGDYKSRADRHRRITDTPAWSYS